MIVRTDTLEKVLESHPQLKDVFETQGFKGLDNKLILKQIGSFALETLCKNKSLNVELFVEMLNEHVNAKETDVTLMDNVKKENAIEVIGLLPCPVRIPLLEQFSNLSNLDRINHNLKAASEGLDWLKEDVEAAKDENDLAYEVENVPVYIKKTVVLHVTGLQLDHVNEGEVSGFLFKKED